MPGRISQRVTGCFYRNVMVFILVNDQCGVGDDSSGGRGQRHGNTADGYKNTSRDLHRCILISEDFLLHGRFHQARLAAALCRIVLSLTTT